MNVKRLEMDPVEDKTMYSTSDETELTTDFCMANIGENDAHYMSCGERLRRRKNGTSRCPIHGEMH